MCRIIQTADGEQIDSPLQLKQLGITLIADPNYKFIPPDSCLCPVDIEATLKKAGIAYKQDYWGDFTLSPVAGRTVRE